MEDEIKEKLKSLQNYVPFIDYVISIDSEKYNKFKSIKTWIVENRRLPLSDLNKIEQSIITSYKNFTLEDKKIPVEIVKIFWKDAKHQFVNLCSDDEEEGDCAPSVSQVEQIEPEVECLENDKPISKIRNNSNDTRQIQKDSDDDIEIVSVSLAQNSTAQNTESITTVKREKLRKKSPSPNTEFTHKNTTDGVLQLESESADDLDIETARLLEQIDQIDLISSIDLHSRRNTGERSSNDGYTEDREEILFQRRSSRKGCSVPEADENVPKVISTNTINAGIIALDSSDDEDVDVKIQNVGTDNAMDILKHSPRAETNVPTDIVCDENCSAREEVNLNESECDLKTEKSAADDMLNVIYERIPKLDHQQLKALLEVIEADTTEPSTPEKERNLPSSSCSINSEQSGSPPPPAPRIEESSDNLKYLVKALVEILEKANKSASETTANTSNSTAVPRSNLPFPPPVPQQFQHFNNYPRPHPPPPQYVNFYINPTMQNAIYNPHHSGSTPQVMQPNFVPCQLQPSHTPIESHIPAVPQFVTPQPQTSLNSRDPRLNSSLYQRYLRLIQAEISKRQAEMTTNYNNQPNVPVVPVDPMSNNLPNQINRPISSSHTSLGVPQAERTTNYTSQPNVPVDPMSNNSPNPINRPISNYHTSIGAPQQSQSQSQSQYYRMSEAIDTDSHPSTSTKSSITYGEYKRRQSEERNKKREQEIRRLQAFVRRNEDESNLVEAATSAQNHHNGNLNHETSDRDQNGLDTPAPAPAEVDTKKNNAGGEVVDGTEAENMLEILFNTLQPYEDKIERVWNAKKDEKSSDKVEKMGDERNKTEKEKSKHIKRKRKSSAVSDDTNESDSGGSRVQSNRSPIETEEDEYNLPENFRFDDERLSIQNRIDRMNKEINCTMKGFDKPCNAIANPVGKRRCSLNARLFTSSDLSNALDENEPSSFSGASKKRRSSIDSHLSKEFDPRQSAKKINSRSPINTDKSIKRAILKSSNNLSESCNMPEKSDDSKTKSILQNQPKVWLKRLNQEVIHKHTKKVAAVQKKSMKPKNVLSVDLIECGVRPQSAGCRKKTPPSAAKKPCLKILNNDCQMTGRNTKFCALCHSKPSDLTNHYRQKHNSESYVSRLSWSELDDLCMNTPFALEVKSSPNSRYKRYEVLCPFCGEKLLMPFMDLYNHYASHTGEYAFQCESCELEKPFKADIISHQLHRKTCRNSQIQVLYRYPPDTMSIYLYYCIICNFVQLNKGSILKHLSEHHNTQKANAKYFQKCILAAISMGTESNPSPEEQSPNNAVTQLNGTADKNSDNKETEETATLPKVEPNLKIEDNIEVLNEACVEDPMDLDEQLRLMHAEGQTNTDNAPSTIPMTVVHYDSQSLTCGENVFNKAAIRHLPKVFKSEAELDLDETFQLTPDNTYTMADKVDKEAFTNYVATYSDYRQFPANVNYLGFYKCMADDCFYSSDAPEQFVAHIEGHRDLNIPENYLLCPYCNISPECYESVHKLVEHLQVYHAHLLYQCSMCCYRSCEALYVSTHQKENHPLYVETCAIYKCSGREVSCDLDYIKENMAKYVTNVKCSRCSDCYYSTHILMLHMNAMHNIEEQEITRRYSCVYCTFWDESKSVVTKHISLSHPGELPFLCDHNSPSVTEDSLHNLELVNFSEPVTITEASCTYDILPVQDNTDTEIDKDIKPTIMGLITFQTENVKVRLRKLTEKTGVAPDNLYRCSDQLCGGFFSIYDLWLRHMRSKHNCCEAECPHCCMQTIKPLEEFASHFETHRRHTFICFHCPLTAANDHEAQMHWLQAHSDLGQMHVEKIRMNLNYSYSILIESNKSCQSQTEFLSSLNALLEKRIKELEDNEATKLKHEWLVPNDSSSLWLENFPRNALSTKHWRKCFSSNCEFRTRCDDELFSHVRSNHVITGSVFVCSKCDFRITNARSWDDILNHIKQHSETSFFVCCACSQYFLFRSRIMDHIKSDHASRDVPILNLFRKTNPSSIYAKIGIVFATERLTFSTMRNCFCCKERGLNGHALMLHLKRYHNFVLNYFCEWCNMPIDSLLAAEVHFLKCHTTNKLKIRCEIAAKVNLAIISIREFEIRISSGDNLPDLVVKQELPDADDSIIIMEDEDVIAEVHETKMEENAEKPKLKCIALDSLIDPKLRDNAGSSNAVQLRVLPRIKIVSRRNSRVEPTKNEDHPSLRQLLTNNQNIPDSFLPSQQRFPPSAVSHLQPSSQFQMGEGNNNFGNRNS